MSINTAEIQGNGVGQDGRRFHWPVKTAQAIYLGNMVSQLVSDGTLVPTTTAGAGRVIGVAKQTIASASAGERCAIETDRIYRWTNGSSTNAFSEATQYGAPAYAFDDHTVYDNSNGDTLPFAGFFRGMDADGKVLVEIVGIDVAGVDEVATGGDLVTTFRARNAVVANVADLGAFTVAGNDGITNVAGDVVLLVAQTTPAQNGLYVVGTVAAGAAPLTRHPGMPAGLVFRADDFDVVLGAGTLFAHSRWFNSAAGTIGTNDGAFYPESVVISTALTAGTVTIATVPILSATKTAIIPYRKTANTTADTIQYVTNGAATPGAIGTASVAVMAAVAAGTINVADVSTLHITIINR